MALEGAASLTGLNACLVSDYGVDMRNSTCLGLKLVPKDVTEVKFCDAYAVEFIDWGIVHEADLLGTGGYILCDKSEMYRFSVHGFQRSKIQPSLWVESAYTFGHVDSQTCQMWVHHINVSLDKQHSRPKSLLVLVHPLSGKGNGCGTWESVAPMFSRAQVRTKVIVTERAGHAFDVMASATDKELNSYNGVVAVGGDGLFNEILNGLLSRKRFPYPPAPTNLVHSAQNESFPSVSDLTNAVAAASDQNEVQVPLLRKENHSGSALSGFCMYSENLIIGKQTRHLYYRNNNYLSDIENVRLQIVKVELPVVVSFHIPCSGKKLIHLVLRHFFFPLADQDPEFTLPNDKFKFGIIPSGSTDAIVICTTGARDPVTSALQIVLGRKLCLDIAQVVRWKKNAAEVEPCVRYAASFTGYGFYGDVITESEKYRWMGPKRYDYAGTKVFLKHRSYEAEIEYLEVKFEKSCIKSEDSQEGSRKNSVWRRSKSEQEICCSDCVVCNAISPPRGLPVTQYTFPNESRWMKTKGQFLSVGAAIISCRNERAPDGLVADAHLSDGFLHLILIKDCPHASYLWHLTQLARKGGKPLDFDFVEHYKTPVFTFTSSGDQSVWNLDGEPFPAHQLSAQVLRGLVTMFAAGPKYH